MQRAGENVTVAARSTQRERNVGQAASLPPFSWGTLPACPSFGFSVRFPVPVPDTGPSLGLFGIHISSDGHAGSVPTFGVPACGAFVETPLHLVSRPLQGLWRVFADSFPRASEASPLGSRVAPLRGFQITRPRTRPKLCHSRNCATADGATMKALEGARLYSPGRRLRSPGSTGHKKTYKKP